MNFNCELAAAIAKQDMERLSVKNCYVRGLMRSTISDMVKVMQWQKCSSYLESDVLQHELRDSTVNVLADELIRGFWRDLKSDSPTVF